MVSIISLLVPTLYQGTHNRNTNSGILCQQRDIYSIYHYMQVRIEYFRVESSQCANLNNFCWRKKCPCQPVLDTVNFYV